MKTLIIYNLETDLDSQVLAAAHDWVEAFAAQVDKVFVYSTHVGQTNLPANVVVKELGGGSFLKRLVGLFRLYKSFAISLMVMFFLSASLIFASCAVIFFASSVVLG